MLEPIDTKALRARLKMNRTDFCLAYGLPYDTVRSWEHARRTPTPAAATYLRVIAAIPKQVRNALKPQEQLIRERLVGADDEF